MIPAEAVEAERGDFREDLRSRTPRRSGSNFDIETGRPLGPQCSQELGTAK